MDTREIGKVVLWDAEVVSGELVFTGIRVRVQNLIDYLAGGHTLDDFLAGFPGVSREQAEAYLRMSVEAAREKLVAGCRAGSPG